MIEQIKKIAEQVEENESKKLLLEAEITHLEEVLKHGVSSRFAEENAIYIYSPKTGHEIRRKLEDDYKLMRSKLSIPKKIAEELEELTGKTNWESTPYSVIEEKGKINTWAYLGHGKCSEQLYKFCRDNTRLMHAYLNPLTRPFVEVTDE